MNGKGDTYRPYDPDKFGSEYDRIFGKTNEDEIKEDIDPEEFVETKTE